MVAAGAGAFGPNRPPLEGLPAYEASGAVQYYVRRREDLRGKRVVIAGGGDSAVDWALALKDIARVAVVHRRPKFRAAPESAAQLDAAARKGEIEMVIPYQLHALHGADGVLAEVEVATLQGETRRLPADVLLPFFGLSMDLGPIAAWGLEQRAAPREDRSGDLPDQRCRACSRSATWRPIPGKLKLILQGFSEAAVAAHAIFGDRASGRGAALRVFDHQGHSLSLGHATGANPVRQPPVCIQGAVGFRAAASKASTRASIF